MRDAVELFAELPRDAGTFANRDGVPEEHVEFVSLLPGAEDLSPPLLAGFPASLCVHATRLAYSLDDLGERDSFVG